MDLLKSIAVATSGLRSQSGRMRVIAENMANADSGPERAGADPYRRKIPTFQRRFDRELEAQVVDMGRVQRDQSAFRNKFEPGNPTADASGNVRMPNVNSLIETMDMREAQRSYEANLNLISSTRRMIQRTIDILRALKDLLAMATPSFAAGAYASIQGMGAGSLLRKPVSAGASETGGADFASMIGKALEATADAGTKADRQTASVATGRADVVDVVTAVAESEAAIETLVAVRDRVIAAYEEIMRMPV